MKYNVEDLKIDIYRGSQNVNIGSNFVRITHIPTGIIVKSEDHVPVNINKQRALDLLNNMEDVIK